MKKIYLTAGLMTVFVYGGCKSTTEDSGTRNIVEYQTSWSGGGNQKISENEQNVLHEFRNIFYNVLKTQKNIRNPEQAKNELDSAIYMPTTSWIQKSRSKQVQANPQDIRKFSDNIDGQVEDFYRNGVATAPKEMSNFRDVFKKKKATLVFVPGLFGENIGMAPVSEVLDKDVQVTSLFHKKYRSVFSAASFTDTSFDLSEIKWSQNFQSKLTEYFRFGQFRFPMSNFVDYGSIDINNENKVNVLFLRSRPGSFETFGTAVDSAQVFNRRMNMIFDKIKPEDKENIYLVGYSRGTVVGLEMLAQANENPERNSWIKNVKGFITYSGVVLGSELSDVALIKTAGLPDSKQPQSYKMRIILDHFLGPVKGNPTDSQDSERIIVPGDPRYINMSDHEINRRNIKNQKLMVKRLLALSADPTEFGFSAEHPDGGMSNMLSMVSLLRRNRVGIVGNLLKELVFPNKDHFLKLKLGYLRFIQAVTSLATQNRIDWWKTRGKSLPQDITYYSISGSMPSATIEGDGEGGGSRPKKSILLTVGAKNYGTNTNDYVMGLRAGYYTLSNVSGNRISDGQVTQAKSRFWPEMTEHLNFPKRSKFLGTVATHHWGIAWKEALKHSIFSGNSRVNMFPRKALVESIAIYVLNDLK